MKLLDTAAPKGQSSSPWEPKPRGLDHQHAACLDEIGQVIARQVGEVAETVQPNRREAAQHRAGHGILLDELEGVAQAGQGCC